MFITVDEHLGMPVVSFSVSIDRDSSTFEVLDDFDGQCVFFPMKQSIVMEWVRDGVIVKLMHLSWVAVVSKYDFFHFRHYGDDGDF